MRYPPDVVVFVEWIVELIEATWNWFKKRRNRK